MSSEVWATVPEYDGLYEVSTFGRVRSVDRKQSVPNRWGGTTVRLLKGHLLKPKFDGKRNYQHVGLSCNGQTRAVNVHRLVATVFPHSHFIS